MLLGRDRERQGLAAALESARRGSSAVLLLVGGPGIGKTALLDDTAAAAPAGMRVLRARGVESEAQIPFAGLLELLRPVLGELDRIPGPQADALAGALALRPATAPDRFAVGAATLSLLAAAAEAPPLAVLVDDGQWLDASSAQAILFAARRLIADPIAIVVALRAGEPSPLAEAGLPVLVVPGLARGAASELIAATSTAAPGEEVVERLHRATGGNPLALLELAG